MRRTIYSILSTHPELSGVVGGWHPHGSLDEAPERPFGTYRVRLSSKGVTSRSIFRPVDVEFWVHDDPGSYLRIDDLLTKIESVFSNLGYTSAVEGESISTADFTSRGPDLNDDGLRTITKMTLFTFIGKGQ